MRRTRLGKTVGSYRTPLDAWTYWQENGKWVAVAPSGARMRTFARKADCVRYIDVENREWDRSA